MSLNFDSLDTAIFHTSSLTHPRPRRLCPIAYVCTQTPPHQHNGNPTRTSAELPECKKCTLTRKSRPKPKRTAAGRDQGMPHLFLPSPHSQEPLEIAALQGPCPVTRNLLFSTPSWPLASVPRSETHTLPTTSTCGGSTRCAPVGEQAFKSHLHGPIDDGRALASPGLPNSMKRCAFVKEYLSLISSTRGWERSVHEHSMYVHVVNNNINA